MKSVIEEGFFHEFAFDTKHLKHSSNFVSVQNVRSSNVVKFEFRLRHSSIKLKFSIVFSCEHEFHNSDVCFVLKMLLFLPERVALCLKQLFFIGGPRF